MTTSGSAVSVFPNSASTTDVQILIDRVAELERSQRQEDVEGFLALFDESAVWVNGAGQRLIGLEAISAFTRMVLPGAFSSGSVNYGVEHISFIRPDIALTGVRQEYVDRQGAPLDGGFEGCPSYVWAKAGGTWKIVARQNTAVDAEG